MKINNTLIVTTLALSPALVLAHGTQIPIAIEGGRIVTYEWGLGGDTTIAGKSRDRLFTIPLSEYTATAANAGWYGTPQDDSDPLTSANSAFSHPGLAYGRSTFQNGTTLSVSFVQEASVWNGSSFGSTGGEMIQALRGGSLTATFPNWVRSDGTSNGTGTSIALSGLNADSHSTIRWRMLDSTGSSTGMIEDGIYLAMLQISTDQIGVQSSLPYAFLFTKNASSTDIAAAEAFVSANIIPEPASLSALGLLAAGTLARRRR